MENEGLCLDFIVSTTVWDPGITLTCGRSQLVGVHHQIMSLRLSRGGTIGDDRVELETSSYIAEVYDTIWVASKLRMKIPRKEPSYVKKRAFNSCHIELKILCKSARKRDRISAENLCQARFKIQEWALNWAQRGAQYGPKHSPDLA